MDKKRIGLLGAGGQADEAESFFRSNGDVIFRAVDKQYITTSQTEGLIDIQNPTEVQKNTPVVAAVGAPAIRRELISRWAGSRFEIIRAEGLYIDGTVKIGEGTIIATGSVVTTNVTIGKHCIVNVAATISHNSKLGDFSTIGPGANIAGNVTLGDGVFVGIGAVIKNGVKIANGCVVGAGAVVLDDIEEENSVVIGVPARVARVNEGWLREI